MVRSPGRAMLMLLTAFFLCAVSSLGQAQTYTVTKYQHIPYGVDPNNSYNWLDIYRPNGLTNRPVVFFVHGGAWSSGDKSEYDELGRTLSGFYGYPTVVINYRLSPAVIHPAHVQDTAKAFAWVYRNIANYGGNRDRIFPFGHSAGGHLVALMATDDSYLKAEGLSSSTIRGVISFSGCYNITKLPSWWSAKVQSAFGTTRPSKLWPASPAAWLDSWQPPFQVVYAQTELAGLDGQAKEWNSSLAAKGTVTTLTMISGKDHTTEIKDINTANPTSVSTMLVVNFIEAYK